jgi:RNA polymerase sigma-70 factor (ECF subfamily)
VEADGGGAPPSAPRSGAADAELITRLRRGDEAAFSHLLHLYHAALVRLALAYVPSRAVAEEVVQETWVGVLDGLAAFAGRSSLKTWLFRILTNRAKTRGVRERRTIPFSSLSDAETDPEPAVPPERFRASGMWGVSPRRWEDDAPEQVLMNQQALAHLEEAIAALPPNQRVVVTLRDIDGLSADEVCNVLGISETNQRVLLHRARSRLRGVLEEYLERK